MNTKHTRSEATANDFMAVGKSTIALEASLLRDHGTAFEKAKFLARQGWTVGKDFYKNPAQPAKS